MSKIIIAIGIGLWTLSKILQSACSKWQWDFTTYNRVKTYPKWIYWLRLLSYGVMAFGGLQLV